jgi:hypothetical protein
MSNSIGFRERRAIVLELHAELGAVNLENGFTRRLRNGAELREHGTGIA